MGDFKDYFSTQADIYARYRPLYPAALFEFLSTLTKDHACAWDCGTGNGQAAAGLTAFYNQVIATDPSAQQIAHAFPHEKVIYRVESAEETSLEAGSIDLITTANALHWFNLDRFYPEVRRVTNPGGILASWAYGVPEIAPEIDEIVVRYHDETLGSYWKPGNRMVEQKYSTLEFPFPLVEAPKFYMEKTFDLPEFIGYLNTWSATQRFITENNSDPTEALFEELLTAWKDPSIQRKLSWELILRIGRIHS